MTAPRRWSLTVAAVGRYCYFDWTCYRKTGLGPIVAVKNYCFVVTAAAKVDCVVIDDAVVGSASHLVVPFRGGGEDDDEDGGGCCGCATLVYDVVSMGMRE